MHLGRNFERAMAQLTWSLTCSIKRLLLFCNTKKKSKSRSQVWTEKKRHNIPHLTSTEVTLDLIDALNGENKPNVSTGTEVSQSNDESKIIGNN